MSIYLLDVNVLVALAWSNYVHHPFVSRWFANRVTTGWATCPITQAGFIRMSMNPLVLGSTITSDQAMNVLQQLISDQSHQFLPDDISIHESFKGLKVTGYRQVTDAYLIGLARSRRGMFATLDRGATALDANIELVS